MSVDDDDRLTREEKAARIRAEIARRREQLNSDDRLLRPSSSLLDPSGLDRVSPSSFYDDDPSMTGHHGGEYYPEDEMYVDYERDLMYDSRFLDPRIARLQNAAYLSRSLDTAFEEYDAYEQEMLERERIMRLSSRLGRGTTGTEFDYDGLVPGMGNEFSMLGYFGNILFDSLLHLSFFHFPLFLSLSLLPLSLSLQHFLPRNGQSSYRSLPS